jgi:hypothetical protein
MTWATSRSTGAMPVVASHRPEHLGPVGIPGRVVRPGAPPPGHSRARRAGGGRAAAAGSRGTGPVPAEGTDLAEVPAEGEDANLDLLRGPVHRVGKGWPLRPFDAVQPLPRRAAHPPLDGGETHPERSGDGPEGLTRTGGLYHRPASHLTRASLAMSRHPVLPDTSILISMLWHTNDAEAVASGR